MGGLGYISGTMREQGDISGPMEGLGYISGPMGGLGYISGIMREQGDISYGLQKNISRTSTELEDTSRLQ